MCVLVGWTANSGVIGLFLEEVDNKGVIGLSIALRLYFIKDGVEECVLDG